MAKYKLKSGSHTMGGIRYKAGVKDSDILDLTDEQAKQFEEGRLIPLGGDNGGSDNSGNGAKVESKLETKEEANNIIDKDSVKLLDSNDINLITQNISTITDLTILETLYNYEESNKNRQNILDSINKQYESLGSQDNKETNVSNADSVITAKKGKK